MSQERGAVIFIAPDGTLTQAPLDGPKRCTEEAYDAAMDYHIDVPAAGILVNPFFDHPSKQDYSTAVHYAFLDEEGRTRTVWVSHDGKITNIACSLGTRKELAAEIEDKYGLFFG